MCRIYLGHIKEEAKVVMGRKTKGRGEKLQEFQDRLIVGMDIISSINTRQASLEDRYSIG